MTNILELKRIAFRSLARHKVKTALSILAIAVSVTLYICMDSWMLGMTVDSKRNVVSYETGAAKLQTQAYFDKLDDLPMYESFGAWQRYASALERAGFTASPRFVFTGTLYSETGSAPVVFNAVDPSLDSAVLRVDTALDAGRYINAGAFEIILGNITAEKLKVGLPMRPTSAELEDDILAMLPASEHEFVRGLYQPQSSGGNGGPYAPKEAAALRGGTPLLIRRDITQADRARYWALLAATGRMNVNISTVIDIKAPPDSVRAERFDVDLAGDGGFTAQELALFKDAYQYDDLTRAWYLSSTDAALLDAVLAAMVRIDYSGAVRHVNQLVSAVVVGTVNSPDPKINNNTAYIPLDALQDEAGLMLEGRVTELVIRAKGASDTRLPGAGESAQVIKAALERELGAPLDASLGVFGWEGYAKDLFAAAAGDNWTTRIMAVILFIL
jgi:ABC-type lipoprotein release transport system permease subunit